MLYSCTHQRRRNRGGNGGAGPRNAETARGGGWGAKVYLFAPAIYAEFISWLHTVLHSGTAGELTRRTQHVQNPTGEAYTVLPRSQARRALTAIPAFPETLLSPSDFEFALPPQC